MGQFLTERPRWPITEQDCPKNEGHPVDFRPPLFRNPIDQNMQLTAISTAATLASAQPAPHLHFYHQGRQSMPLCELISLQSEDNYTWLIWTNGKRMLMPRTLKYYEAQLPLDGFIRLHRNYAVNVSHIVAVCKLPRTGIDVRLSNGTRLSVARRRWVQIRDRLYQLGIRAHG